MIKKMEENQKLTVCESECNRTATTQNENGGFECEFVINKTCKFYENFIWTNCYTHLCKL